MHKNWMITTALLLLFLSVMQIPVFAAENTVVELPFTIENTPGTVVIEPLDGAPAPAQEQFTEVTEGRFALSFSDPGDYRYRIYQKPGTLPCVTYDETVYDVMISVFVDDNGSLYSVTVLSIDGEAHKPEQVVFTNEALPADIRIEKTQARGGEKPTTELLSVTPGNEITYFITVENISEGTAKDLTVTDEIPEGLMLVPDSISNDGSERDGIVTWYLGDVEAGDILTVSFRVTIPNVKVETHWINRAVAAFTDASYSGAAGATKTLETNKVEAVCVPEKTSNVPQTGDNTHLNLWIALMVVSFVTGTGLTAFLLAEKKRR